MVRKPKAWDGCRLGLCGTGLAGTALSELETTSMETRPVGICGPGRSCFSRIGGSLTPRTNSVRIPGDSATISNGYHTASPSPTPASWPTHGFISAELVHRLQVLE